MLEESDIFYFPFPSRVGRRILFVFLKQMKLTSFVQPAVRLLHKNIIKEFYLRQILIKLRLSINAMVLQLSETVLLAKCLFLQKASASVVF